MVAQYKKETLTDKNQVITWSGGAHCSLPSLKFYGMSEQTGIPSPDSPINISSFSGPCMVNNDWYIHTPTLNGIGKYRDEWDYVTGKGLRRVASITLDGVLNNRKILAVVKQASSGYYYAIANLEHESVEYPSAPIISTHFKGETGIFPGRLYATYSAKLIVESLVLIHTDQTLDTADKWNAWLKDQYDRGKPVIVYYALANPQPFEERPAYQAYEPIPNEGGVVDIIDSGPYPPFEINYIKHS